MRYSPRLKNRNRAGGSRRLSPAWRRLGLFGCHSGPRGDVDAALRAGPHAVLSVKANRPLHQMVGGIGASWHSIRVDTRPIAQSATVTTSARPVPRAARWAPICRSTPQAGKTSSDWVNGWAWIGFGSRWTGECMNRKEADLTGRVKRCAPFIASLTGASATARMCF